MTEDEVAEAGQSIAGRWLQCLRPSYEVRRAREAARGAAGMERRMSGGEHGTEWGAVIHTLLEAALLGAESNLEPLARAALGEQGFPASLADEALDVVAAVRDSPLWRRAVEAERLFVETPFALWLDPDDPLIASADQAGEGPVLVRGVVDLAFLDGDGWVIVDWKTDAVRTSAELEARTRHHAPQVRLYAAVWGRISGDPIAEYGLYFTASRRYQRLDGDT